MIAFLPPTQHPCCGGPCGGAGRTCRLWKRRSGVSSSALLFRRRHCRMYRVYTLLRCRQF
ncbi:hypothetical protein C4D60_Mb09t19550 [Musa balbisiana]|uniref:Uncharacterized protein n=1 Tax=Musa balbisiana TaxID=52838 RepID=A0A4S8IIC7_MUSBA|nr:hypothetical protein C4D60_Mb09t19550 [Musa balbisiana]